RPQPLPLLAAEELLFARQTPAIAGAVAVGAGDAMAGNDDGEVVGGAGAGDRPRGAGGADRARDLGVAAGLAGRDAPQLLPDALLEGGAVDVEGDVQRARPLDRLDDLVDPGRDRLGRELGVGKAPPQAIDDLLRRLAEANVAHAAFGPGDEQVPEGTGTDGVADGVTA